MKKEKVVINSYSIVHDIANCINLYNYYRQMSSSICSDKLSSIGFTEEELKAMDILIDAYDRKSKELRERAEKHIEEEFAKHEERVIQLYNFYNKKEVSWVAKTKCEVYSRVVGYLAPVSQFNRGKVEEFKDRKTYDKALKE